MTELEAQESPFYGILTAQFPAMSARDRVQFVRSLAIDEPYSPWMPAGREPRGRLVAGRHRGEGCYPGVERNYWTYIPAQYDPARPANLMVFQDGERYLGPEMNAAPAFDALIESGDLPVTIGVFVQPGETGPGLPLYGGVDNRSVEYDALGDNYARFLVDELLPLATAGLSVNADPAARAICGLSSGGICAFNAAWERPDQFSKVLTHCASFVDIRGGHQLAGMVRRGDARPLRVFLQTGEHDLNISFGHWELANRTMAAALAYRGYDHQLVVGAGGHSLKHGGAIFADAMKWLWREVQA